jgi:hypothetical protein
MTQIIWHSGAAVAEQLGDQGHCSIDTTAITRRSMRSLTAAELPEHAMTQRAKLGERPEMTLKLRRSGSGGDRAPTEVTPRFTRQLRSPIM